MATTKDSLAALKDKNYKLTPQRRVILRAISNSKKHLTPAEVYELVKEKHPRISLVTVYRTLRVLTELGLVCEIRTGANAHSYVAGNPASHGHLVCTSCGAVQDFEYSLDDQIMKVGAEFDYCIDDHRLDLYGICPRCGNR